MGDARAVDLSVRRILMGHALIASYGGIPLIYMGDEVGLTNDLSFLSDPERAGDGRWMQRPFMRWETPTGPAARIRDGIRRVLARRAATPQLSGAVPTHVLRPDDRSVLAFSRPGADTLVAAFNMAGEPREVGLASLGLAHGAYWCALSERSAEVAEGRLRLTPYDAVWLTPQ